MARPAAAALLARTLLEAGDRPFQVQAACIPVEADLPVQVVGTAYLRVQAGAYHVLVAEASHRDPSRWAGASRDLRVRGWALSSSGSRQGLEVRGRLPWEAGDPGRAARRVRDGLRGLVLLRVLGRLALLDLEAGDSFLLL